MGDTSRVKHLPESELKFLMGYAEGVIAASKRQKEADPPPA